MKDHRIRLDDQELAWVISALRGRAAGMSRETAFRMLSLAARLDVGKKGNPDWILGRGREVGQSSVSDTDAWVATPGETERSHSD